MGGKNILGMGKTTHRNFFSRILGQEGTHCTLYSLTATKEI